MPYIDPMRKAILITFKEPPENPGELNFLITHMCNNYIKFRGENYQHYNDIIGALEGSKLEIYRRLISKYEDKKIKENGDVF